MAVKPKNILKFSSPAKWWGSGWREALVTGNGIIGCSVLGGASEDTLMLSHSDLWWQGKAGVLQDVSGQIDKVRKLINEGKYKEAQTIVPDTLISKGYRPMMSYPLPLCDFKIRQKTDKPPRDYVRALSLDTGEITVAFKDGATRYQRSVFVSRGEDIVVFEVTKSGLKAIDADFSFEMHERFNNRTPMAISNLPEGINTKSEGKFLFFTARSDNGSEFGAVAYINFFGGTLVNEGSVARVRGAEKIFIIIKTFINVKNYENKWKELRDELKGFKNTYEKLLREQASAMAKVFGKAYLSLEDDDSFADKMISDSALSPSSLERLWALGRYLFVSSATPSSPPVAPYGIWCGDYKGFNSHINADGSLQLMYEHALAGNLTEYFDSLFSYYENVIDELRKNAIRLFNARGIMIPSVTSRGIGPLGLVEAAAINFTGAAGWLSKLYYEYYLCTGDVKLLKTKVLPFLKETAQFYMEFFRLQSDSFFESSPSYSPGSEPGNLAGEGTYIVKNSLIDFAIAKELFTNLIEGSEEAGVNKNEIAEWRKFLDHIPSYKINPDGTVKEYFDPKLTDNYKTGSSAMFYPLFPGTEITEKTPDLFKSFDKTAQKRFSFGSQHTSMSLARFANLFVRLDQPQQAEDIIHAMLRHTAMSNLIFSANDWTGMGVASSDIWATYTIESNLILTNAIQEMFVRSDKNTIWLLPACSLQKGELGGFLTRCGVEIMEMEWDRRKGQLSVKLKSKKARTISVKLADPIKRYKGSGTVDPEQNRINGVELPAGKAVLLDLKI